MFYRTNANNSREIDNIFMITHNIFCSHITPGKSLYITSLFYTLKNVWVVLIYRQRHHSQVKLHYTQVKVLYGFMGI